MKPAATVRVTRFFDYPAERVFDAWINPDIACKFLFATEDGEMVRTDIDARPGGRFTITERRGEDGDVKHLGEYVEVDRPHRLVFILTVPKYSPEPARVTVEFRPAAAGCELTLTHELGNEWAKFTDALDSGWKAIFRSLEKTVTPASTASAADATNYVTFPERAAVHFERLLPGPIERVWAYLTEPEKRATWFAGGPWELRAGGKLELHINHTNITEEPAPEKYRAKTQPSEPMRGTITRCEPPRVLAFQWIETNGEFSETVFELTPKGADVLLVLNHYRLPNRDLMMGVAGGWQAHILILEDRLRGRKPRPFWSTHDQLKAIYEQRVRPEDLPVAKPA